MKLKIKEFYKESTFLGLKSGTMLRRNVDRDRMLLFKNNRWGIYKEKNNLWDYPVGDMQCLNESECRIRVSSISVGLLVRACEYLIHETLH